MQREGVERERERERERGREREIDLKYPTFTTLGVCLLV